MRKLFDDMPEELKAMLGIGEESSPTDLKGGNDFDYDNPPLTCEDIPDSVIPAEALKKIVEARNAVIEARKLMIGEGGERFSIILATRSPYAQAQWLFFNDSLEKALVDINTLLHINESGEDGVKSQTDKAAHEEGMLVKDFVRRLLVASTMNKILGL